MLVRDVVLQGRYKIIRQLGQGGMGAVYEAEDTKRFGKEVALKEILIDLAKITNAAQQELIRHAFEREAKILTQVEHEAFPQVVDYFYENDAQFLVMELIQGEDLGELLRNRKSPFQVEEILGWTDQLLDALDYLHTLDPPIIHRDIKPQNLKLTARGKVKLLDFGIAKGADKQVNTTIATQTFIAATLNYSPFEQILRVLDPTFREALMPLYGERIEDVLEQPADPRSDIYALGATLYHLLTNQVPLDALKRALAVWGGKPDALVKPIEINPNIPPAISDWLMRSMEIEWDQRFSSALEMQSALREAIHSESRLVEETKNQAWLKEQEDLRRERLQIEEERRKIESERIQHIQLIEEERNRQLSLRSISEQEAKFLSNQETVEIPATQISFGQHNPPAPTLLKLPDDVIIPPKNGNSPENGTAPEIGKFENNNQATMLEISLPEPEKSAPINNDLSRYSFLPEEFNQIKEATPIIPPVVKKEPEIVTPRKQSYAIVWILPVAALVLCVGVLGIFAAWRFLSGPSTTSDPKNTTVTSTSPIVSTSTSPTPTVSPLPSETSGNVNTGVVIDSPTPVPTKSSSDGKTPKPEPTREKPEPTREKPEPTREKPEPTRPVVTTTRATPGPTVQPCKLLKEC